MSPIVGDILYEDVPLVKSVYIVFSCISDESYRRRLKSLLFMCLWDVFRALIKFFVWKLHINSVLQDWLWVTMH